jgi:hypothetical protein
VLCASRTRLPEGLRRTSLSEGDPEGPRMWINYIGTRILPGADGVSVSGPYRCQGRGI